MKTNIGEGADLPEEPEQPKAEEEAS